MPVIVSRLDLGLQAYLETNFCEFRSRRFQVLRLWILQRNGWLKFILFNHFLFGVCAGKKQPKHVGKMPEMCKNSSRKWWQHFF